MLMKSKVNNTGGMLQMIWQRTVKTFSPFDPVAISDNSNQNSKKVVSERMSVKSSRLQELSECERCFFRKKEEQRSGEMALQKAISHEVSDDAGTVLNRKIIFGGYK